MQIDLDHYNSDVDQTMTGETWNESESMLDMRIVVIKISGLGSLQG